MTVLSNYIGYKVKLSAALFLNSSEIDSLQNNCIIANFKKWFSMSSV